MSQDRHWSGPSGAPNRCNGDLPVVARSTRLRPRDVGALWGLATRRRPVRQLRVRLVIVDLGAAAQIAAREEGEAKHGSDADARVGDDVEVLGEEVGKLLVALAEDTLRRVHHQVDVRPRNGAEIAVLLGGPKGLVGEARLEGRRVGGVEFQDIVVGAHAIAVDNVGERVPLCLVAAHVEELVAGRRRAGEGDISLARVEGGVDAVHHERRNALVEIAGHVCEARLIQHLERV
mmetsp:Transcript_67549/g.185202  ORF Transcript_67549/g.185202 Transcript_67549/m.185202 type:complete len:233 (-) Transcript_67549:353-1051(-)